MAKYVHGEMNIDAQIETFHGLIRWGIRVASASIAILVFLALFNS
ncbi:MAG: aa3-type cytochrome c oxidase subunit IV [Rhodobacterales bacterium]